MKKSIILIVALLFSISTVMAADPGEMTIKQGPENGAMTIKIMMPASIEATGNGEEGLRGVSTTGNGVYGETSAAGYAGVVGTSSNAVGVKGVSEGSHGVYGYSKSKMGVAGESGEGGIGVFGTTIAAGNADSPFKVKLVEFKSAGKTGEHFIGKNLKVFAIDSVWSDGDGYWLPHAAYLTQAESAGHVYYSEKTGVLSYWGDFEKTPSVRCVVIYQ